MAYSLSGFNGQRPDPVSRHYHLGNGYRAYSPVLRRVIAPDSMSPFGVGGINSYAYCAGDPVNRADPSGHFSLGQGIGMLLGFMAGVALGIVTEGAALPAMVTLMATVAGDAAIGVGVELVTQDIDGQRINWNQVGITAGLNAAISLAGFSLGSISKLKGANKRPFSGLMMEGVESSQKLNKPYNQPTSLVDMAINVIAQDKSLFNHGAVVLPKELFGREICTARQNLLNMKFNQFVGDAGGLGGNAERQLRLQALWLVYKPPYTHHQKLMKALDYAAGKAFGYSTGNNIMEFPADGRDIHFSSLSGAYEIIIGEFGPITMKHPLQSKELALRVFRRANVFNDLIQFVQDFLIH
jgi:RHS repeat-associated protein